MFTALVPTTGILGYRTLLQTQSQQIETLEQDAQTARDIAYFKEKIGSVTSSDQLLADRRLLQIGLTAYGLEDQIDSKALIKMVLDQGTETDDAIANRLGDDRWVNFSKAFGFGDSSSGFETSAFQAAVELKFRPTEAEDSGISAEDLAYFRANIGDVASLDDLLADATLLDVSLQAFGVERGYYNEDHFRQLIEEGTGDGDEYAYTLDDSGWVDFAAAFSGLATGGTVETFPRFALDVERELSRRDVLLYEQSAADESDTKISYDDVAYFHETIGSITSGAELVADARLKEVALVAYGLAGTALDDSEIAAILDGGVSDPDSPANQQDDSAWALLASSFDSIVNPGAASAVPEFQIAVEVGIAENGLEPLYYLDTESVETPTIDEEELQYFIDNIGKVESSDDLIADDRLLTVALTAFGLEDEGKSEGYIKALLDEDPYDDDSFVNILDDSRWTEFAKAFTPSGDDSTTASLWRYEIENRLIENDAPEEDLYYLRQRWDDLIDSNLDLVLDTELMNITLSAFGLEKGAYSPSFVLNAMISDTSDPNSFVNQLGDERWIEFAELLGSGSSRGNTALDSFVTETVDRYLTKSFEIAVGDQDQDLRIALNFKREISAIAEGGSVAAAGWYTIMGSEPLRSVVDSLFGLPEQFSQLDVDKQVAVYEKRAQAMFGVSDPSAFAEDGNVARAIETYLLKQSIGNGVSSGAPGYAALSIMQQTAGLARSVNQSA